MAVYYVICDDDCRYEGMTKEQILTAIEQALENGHISDPDGAVISRLKEINKGGATRVWVGTEAEYNALSPAPTAHKLAVRMGADGVLYVCTDDTTLSDYEKHTQDKDNPHEVTLEQVLGGTDESTAKKARDTIGAAEVNHTHKSSDITDMPTYTAESIGAVKKTGDAMTGALGFSTAALGKQTLKNMGIEIQRGVQDNVNSSGVQVTFAEAFSGVPTVIATGGTEVTSVRARDITATGFRLVSGIDNNDAVQWVAIYTAF